MQKLKQWVSPLFRTQERRARIIPPDQSDPRLFRPLQLSELIPSLAQQMDIEQGLQGALDLIRQITGADLALLLPYESTTMQIAPTFLLSGAVLHPDSSHPCNTEHDEVVQRLLRETQPIYAKKSSTLYDMLGISTHERWASYEQSEQVRSTAAFPLVVNDEHPGILFLHFRQLQDFEEPHKSAFHGLARYAANAIKHSQQDRTLAQRQVAELHLIQTISRQINKTLDLKKVLHTILEGAKNHLSAFKGSVLLYNASSHALETADFISDDPEYQEQRSISLSEHKGITRWVFEHKQPARVANVRHDPQWRELYIETDAFLLFSELDVPLLDGEEVIGVINFESTQENAFSQADQDFLVILADQAILAIKNSQEYGALAQRRVEELELLQTISRQISKTLDLAQVLKTILISAKKRLPAYNGSILLYNAETNMLETAAFISDDPTHIQKHQIPLSEQRGITRWVFEYKQPARVANVHTTPPWREIYFEFYKGTYSELDVPLMDGEEIVGVINFESTQEGAFSQDDQDFLETLAGQAVLAIKNAQLHDALQQRRSEELKQLREIDRQISRTLDLQQILQTILKAASTYLPTAYKGSIYLYNSRSQRLETQAYISNDPTFQQTLSIPLDEQKGITRWVFEHKQPARVANVRHDPQWRDLYIENEGLDLLSELDVPLMDGEEIVGVINFESTQEGAFSQDDQDFLETLAGQAVLAIKNAQLHDALQQRRSEELKQLREIERQISRTLDLQQINSTLDLQQILQTILKAANTHLPTAYKGSIYLYNSRGQRLETRAYISNDPTFEQTLSIPLDEQKGITRWVFEHKQPALVANVRNDPQWRDIFIEVAGYNIFSELDVPLLDGEEAIGVLNFESTQEGAFSQADQDFLETLAGQAVLAIKNAQQHQAVVQRRSEELKQLREIDRQISRTLDLQQISRTLDLQQILQTILQAVSTHLPTAYKGSIYLYNSRSQRLETRAYISNDPTFEQTLSIPLDEQKGITRWVFEYKQPARVANVRHDPQWRDLYIENEGLDLLSELDVPLMDGEEIVGVINFESTQEGAFSQDDQDFLETLAGQAVLAIKNAQLHDALQQRRSEELKQLREIDRQINSTLDLQQILQTILKAVSTHLPTAYKGSVLLYNPETQTLDTQAYISNDPQFQQKINLLLTQEKGITRWVFEYKQPALVANVRNDPQWQDLFIEVPGYYALSELDVPLLDGEEAIGVINFESTQEGAFSQADQDFLETLAAQAVLAINKSLEHSKRLSLRLPARVSAQRFLERAGMVVKPEDARTLRVLESRGIRPLKDYIPFLVWLASDDFSVDEVEELVKRARTFEDSPQKHISIVLYNKPPETPVRIRMAEVPFRKEPLTLIPIPLATIEQVLPDSGACIGVLQEYVEQYLYQPDLFDAQTAITDTLAFYGRTGLLESLKADLLKLQSIGIFGLRKFGKTSTLVQLRLMLPQYPTVHLDLELPPKKLHGTWVFNKIIHDLAMLIRDRDSQFPSPEPLAMEQPAAELAPAFVQKIHELTLGLERAGYQLPIICFFDEVDRIFPNRADDRAMVEEFNACFGTLRALSQVEQQMALVVADVHPDCNRINHWPQESVAVNPVFQFFKEVFLAPFSQDETLDMISTIGQLMGRGFDDQTLHAIYRESGGHPYIARQLASLLHNRMPGGRGAPIMHSSVQRYLENPFTYSDSLGSYIEGSIWKDLQGRGDTLAMSILQLLAFELSTEGWLEGKAIRAQLREQFTENTLLGALHWLNQAGLISQMEIPGDNSYRIHIQLLTRWLQMNREEEK